MDVRSMLEIVQMTGALVLNGHFLLSGGRHSRAYFNKDAIYADPLALETVADRIAHRFRSHGFTAVVGPAVGGAILANRVAYRLIQRAGFPVSALFADKAGGEDGFVFRRGYDQKLSGARVLAVEDVLKRGDSAAKTIAAARACGAEVATLAAICNRGGVSAADLGVRELFPLLTLDLEDWAPEDCPACKEGIPIRTDLGHGAGVKENPTAKLPRC